MSAGRAPAWTAPPPAPRLADGEVHLWRAWLDVAPPALTRLGASLSADEQARAAQFRDAVDGQRWRAARGILRAVLASYLGQPPETLTFSYGSQGKPALAGGPAFNLAHSGGLAVIAVAGGPVGVDVEQVVDVPDMLPIAARLMSAADYAVFARLDGDNRRAAFFQWWTAYEALAKARGDGLGGEPANLAFLLDFPADDPIIQIRTTAESWTLTSFYPAAGYAGAVAASIWLHRPHFWQWDAAN